MATTLAVTNDQLYWESKQIDQLLTLEQQATAFQEIVKKVENQLLVVYYVQKKDGQTIKHHYPDLSLTMFLAAKALHRAKLSNRPIYQINQSDLEQVATYTVSNSGLKDGWHAVYVFAFPAIWERVEARIIKELGL